MKQVKHKQVVPSIESVCVRDKLLFSL